MNMSKRKRYKGIKEEILNLLEVSDLAVLDGEVIKSKEKKKPNLYFYEGERILENDNMYINISRYTLSLEIISIKIRCKREYYIANKIAPLINSIIEKNDYVIDLLVV